MMDVLLINGHRHVPGFLPGSNLGMNILLQLARKKGYEAEMLQDYVANIVRKLSQMAAEDDLPKVVGFYTDFNNINWTEKMIVYLKNLKQETVVIVGGPQAVGLDGEFLKRTGADVLCPGEGEESLMELLDFFLRGIGSLSSVQGAGFLQDGTYISTPQRKAKKDLDDIPWPDLSLTNDYSRVIFPIISGRGCPMGCRFCYEGANARNVRYASCENVLNEIRRRAETDPTLRYLNFLDDTFTLNEKRVLEICDGLEEIRKEYDFVWFCNGHVETVLRHPGLIRRMTEAGMKKMFFGFESGSDEMLRHYNKHSTRQMILDTVAMCVEEGLDQIAGNFILGGPFEDKHTLAQSEELVEQLFRIAPGQLDTSYFSFLPYPNTAITREPEKYGIKIYDEYIDCCLEDIPLSRTNSLSYQDLLHERLMKNHVLQKKMRMLYTEGNIPEEVIIHTYQNQKRYMVYSKWMDYVYSHYPVDDSYWNKRANEGYITFREAKHPEDCYVMRTFEIWDYYDTVSRQIMKFPVDGLPLAFLKLCNGKFRMGEILKKMEEQGFTRDAVMHTVADFEERKWILFTEI